MEQYQKYKDSGIEWIGEIPEHWNTKKVKYVTKNLDGKRIPLNSSQRALISGDIPYYGANGIVDYINDFIFNGDYVLIGEDGAPFFIENRNVAFFVTGKFWVNNHAHILQIINGNNPKIITHQFNCVDYREYISGSTRDKLTQDQLSAISLVSIPKSEQTAIANYLDRKTAEIDNLTAKKEQLLTLYEEEKSAVINQAVTKGLNPNTPMKDSGIEWLGDIPEHWKVKRIASLGSFSKGKGISRSDLKDNGYPAILYGDIYTKYNIKTEVIINHIDEETKESSVPIEMGDLLFTGSGETKEDIGKCITYLGNETVYAGGDVIIFKQNLCDSLFLSYSLNNNASIYQKASMAKGQIIVHIYSSNLREIILPLPNKEEQTAIVAHIEKDRERIDAKVAKTKKLIDLLKEYRTALISEAVTGKIKVSN
jgi:type I restriction enzyme S subunit